MGMLFALFYLVPLGIVAIGTHPWVKDNPGLTTPLLMLALLPIANLLAAPVVIIMRIVRAFTKKGTDDAVA
jgi:hypothetical protein